MRNQSFEMHYLQAIKPYLAERLSMLVHTITDRLEVANSLVS